MTLMGSATPRLFTPPLRELTPETSLGFSLATFARDVLEQPLLPWQEDLGIRALELRADGSYRFRTVLALVARQNGKSHLLKVLALWRMYVDGAKLVLGTAQSLQIARESWAGAVELADECLPLAEEVAKVRYDNNQLGLYLLNGARYLLAASTRDAGRGLSVDLLILDEVRSQTDWDAWSSLSRTTVARPRGQIFAISNAGDHDSVVLNSLRESALAGRDESLGLFEWSAPEGCALDDRAGWAAANPALGHTGLSEASILSYLSTDPPEKFRTETLCQRVESLDTAVDPDAWKDCTDLAGAIADGGRLAVGFDISPTTGHATLVVAASQTDGRVRLEVAGAWRTVADARTELAPLIARINPEAVGWYPAGPAAALAPLLKSLPGVEALNGVRVSEACQHLAELASSRRLLHPGDPLLDAQVAGSHRLRQGDGWRFSRFGKASCDAAYAAAAAALLAESMPAPVRHYEGPLVV